MVQDGQGDLGAVRQAVEQAGAGGVMEAADSDGYRALHKAAYNGHAAVIDYLLSRWARLGWWMGEGGVEGERKREGRRVKRRKGTGRKMKDTICFVLEPHTHTHTYTHGYTHTESRTHIHTTSISRKDHSIPFPSLSRILFSSHSPLSLSVAVSLCRFHTLDRITHSHTHTHTLTHAHSHTPHSNAALDATTHDGWTALHCAARWNQVHAAQRLLEAGAELNAQTDGGLTPLHVAASQARPFVLRTRRESA